MEGGENARVDNLHLPGFSRFETALQRAQSAGDGLTALRKIEDPQAALKAKLSDLRESGANRKTPIWFGFSRESYGGATKNRDEDGVDGDPTRQN